MDRLNQTGNRLMRLAALGSQFINVLVFDGSPDETVSGRAYRQGKIQNDAKWSARADRIDRLFSRWQMEHCMKSHAQDKRMADALNELYKRTP